MWPLALRPGESSGGAGQVALMAHTQNPLLLLSLQGPSLDEDEIWRWWCQALVQISSKKTKEVALCEGLLGQQWCFL